MKKCPICGSTKIEEFLGRMKCRRCGYEHLEEGVRLRESQIIKRIKPN